MSTSQCPLCERPVPQKETWRMYKASLFFNKMGSITSCRSCGARLTIKDTPGSKLFGLFLLVLLAVPIAGLLVYIFLIEIPDTFPEQIERIQDMGIDLRFAAAAVIPLLLIVLYLVYLVIFRILYQFTSLTTLGGSESETN